MKIRFLLDNNIISESPEGWEKRISKIRYDSQIKGRLITLEVTLDWFADGYDYIKRIFNENICDEIDVRIQQTDEISNAWFDVYIGKIKMPDCEFHISPYYVKTAIVDNGYFARINNNKGIKSRVDNTKSKNDVLIDVPTPRSCQLFRPHNGNYQYLNRDGYLLYDLFKYYIAFMSDDEVGFVSDTFNKPNGIYSNYVAMLGIEVRLGATNTDKILEMSFTDLFTEVDKKFNIGFRIEYTGTKPIMRIESMSYFYDNTSTARFNNLRDIKKRVDTNGMYASLRVGSSDTIDNIGLKFPEGTRYFGFKDEQFYLLGQCNTERELNLVGNWVVSSNTIEDVVENNNDEYDENIFLIEIVDFVSYQANKSNWLTGVTPPWYYNEHLKNSDVMNRWFDGIPQTVVGQLGLGNNRFIAYRDVDAPIRTSYPSNPCNVCISQHGDTFPSATQGSKFPDDYVRGYDYNNRFGNGTAQGTAVTQANGRYTAPATGQYKFESQIAVKYLPSSVVNTGQDYILMRITFYRFSSANVLISSITNGYSTQTIPSNNEYYHFDSCVINLNATDYVICRQQIQATFNIYTASKKIDTIQTKNSWFACTYCSVDEGGTYQIIDNSYQRFMQYNVQDVPMKQSELDSIINNTSGYIEINTKGTNNYSGWIDEMRVDHFNRTADITLKGSQASEPKND